MLQQMPSLRATTLLEELQRLHPGRYPDRLLRSLQRRVAHWRATEGPERELMFRQEHPPPQGEDHTVQKTPHLGGRALRKAGGEVVRWALRPGNPG